VLLSFVELRAGRQTSPEALFYVTLMVTVLSRFCNDFAIENLNIVMIRGTILSYQELSKIGGQSDMMELMTYLDGSKLKRLRIGHGFSQRELAQKAQMSPSTIVLLEKKPRNEGFHPSTVRKLSEALGVDPNDLLED
jgi:DNA-binding XRE family transcriptional regulator